MGGLTVGAAVALRGGHGEGLSDKGWKQSAGERDRIIHCWSRARLFARYLAVFPTVWTLFLSSARSAQLRRWPRQDRYGAASTWPTPSGGPPRPEQEVQRMVSPSAWLVSIGGAVLPTTPQSSDDVFGCEWRRDGRPSPGRVHL